MKVTKLRRCPKCGRDVFGVDADKNIYVKKISHKQYNIYCKCGTKIGSTTL